MSEDRTKYLTVGTLVAKLSEYPLDAVVILQDPDTYWDAPIFVKLDEDGTVVLWSEYGEMDGKYPQTFYRRPA